MRPAWSPDGREVYYTNDWGGAGVGPVGANRADGTGTARRVLRPKFNIGQVVPSRDGRWLVVRSDAADVGRGDIYAVRTGDTTLVPMVATPATELFAALSPDGRFLAYSSNESGTTEVYVRPFPETATAKWQVSTSGGTEPVWARSGRELFYVNGRDQLVAAEIRRGDVFSVAEQRALFSMAPYYRTSGVPSFDVTPDDRRFVLIREGQASQQSELILAENWLQVLRGKP